MNPYASPPREISPAGQRTIIGALAIGLLINLLLNLGVISL